MGGRRACRTARRRPLPAHRRAAVPAHSGRPRLLLVAHPPHTTPRRRTGRAGRAHRPARIERGAHAGTTGGRADPGGTCVIETEELQQHLQRLVAGWLPTQRWYAGKGRAGSVGVDLLAPLSDAVQVWLVRVTYGEEGTELYQLPLVEHREPVDHLDHVLLGTYEDDKGLVWVYDALHDKDVTAVWVESIRDERQDGALSFQRYADAEAL